MAKILVFQHVAAEPLGTLDPLIRARGHRIRYINFSREPDAIPKAERYDALIVLGGPMMPDQQSQYPHLRTECLAIEHFLKTGKPILGICLGSQLLAHTLGSPVKPASGWEIGWYPLDITAAGQKDLLLQHYPHQQPVFQWHGYMAEAPRSSQILASSPICPMQAFCYQQHAWGLQFHLELDARLINRWLNTDDYLQELAQSGVDSNAETIRHATDRHMPVSLQTSEAVFSAFLEQLEPHGERITLHSR